MDYLYWLLCIFIGLIPAFLLFRSDRRKNIPVKWLPSVLRFITFFATAALLLAPAFPTLKTEEEKPVLLWLQDNSTSMSHALGSDSLLYFKKSKALQDQWEDDYTVVPLAFGPGLDKDSLFHLRQRSTDIASAIQQATEQYQDRNIGAVILSSDGIVNEGLNPEFAPAVNAVPIYSIALGDSVQPVDINIGRVYANKTIALNSEFEVLVDVNAVKLNGKSSEVKLIHNGTSIASASLKVDRDRFTATQRFIVRAEEKGFQRYTIYVPAQEGELNTTNNKLDFFVEVVDESVNVLIVSNAPHPDIAAVRAALEGVPQYKVTVSTNGAIPADVRNYNLIIADQYALNPVQRKSAEGIPVWYILGNNSNINELNNAQQVVKISGNGSPNASLPSLNEAFNYFSLPTGIREVLSKMPPLQAPYGNYSVVAGTEALLTQKIGNVSTNYPLWIFQGGAVPGAVLCGEGIWRWRIYEYKNSGKHEVVDELIRQTVSLLSVKKDNRPFRVYLEKYIFSDNEPVRLFAELRNANAELINGPEVSVTITDTAGHQLQYKFEKAENRYQLNTGLLAAGVYTYKSKIDYNGKSYTAEGSFVVESVPLEQMRQYSDYDLIYKLSKQSNGAFFTLNNMERITEELKKNKFIKPVIHTEKSFRSLIDMRWLFFVILIFASSEWLLRKYWNA